MKTRNNNKARILIGTNFSIAEELDDIRLFDEAKKGKSKSIEFELYLKNRNNKNRNYKS